MDSFQQATVIYHFFLAVIFLAKMWEWNGEGKAYFKH